MKLFFLGSFSDAELPYSYEVTPKINPFLFSPFIPLVVKFSIICVTSYSWGAV
jgi:hypothetical protein